MKDIDLQQVALRIAQRLRAIAIKDNLVPIGKPTPGVGKRTGGELRKSIHVSRHGNGAIVGTNKIYARAVHEGRRALIIRPKRKKMLRWGQPGGFVFARKVFQPARKGKPFFRQAIDKFQGNVDKELRSIGLDREMTEYLAANLRRQGVSVKVIN